MTVRSYTEEIYKTYTTARHRLGSIIEFPDGRKFRFTLNGAVALLPARLLQSTVPASQHLNIACDVARAIGALKISATMGALAAALDLYKDGYVYVNDAVGEGHLYRIKGNAAAASSAVLTADLYSDTPVLVALTTASEVTFIRNPFAGVLIHDSPPTAPLAGVTVRDVAASVYFWAQTHGPCAVLTQGTLIIGDLCVPSATVDGAVMPSAALETDGPAVGNVMAVNADTEQSLINLAIP